MAICVLIPARGGSKRIPNKNLVAIGGMSLLEISIGVARESGFANDTWVSSDSHEVLELAKKLGAQSVERPANLSSDQATADQVVEHFIERSRLEPEDVIVYLQPTSPLRPASTILRCLDYCITTGRPAITVTPVSTPIEKLVTIGIDGLLHPVFPASFSPTANAQELSQNHVPTGSVYVFRVGDFQRVGGFPIIGAGPIVEEFPDCIDIDNELDLALARFAFRDRSPHDS